MTNQAPGPADDPPWRDVVGREPQRREARAAIEDERVLVLSGEVGIGKSTFLDALAAELTERSFEVVRLRANASSRDVPLGVFTSLLADAAAHGDGVEPMSVVLRTLTGDGAHQRVVMVDDAQDLDAQSATVVAHLASNDAVRLVVAHRAGELLPPAVESVRAGPNVVEVALAPLSPEESTALVTTLAADRLSRAEIDEICRKSDGVPFFLVEVTGMHTESGKSDGVVGRGLRRAVEGRLAPLDAAARAVLEYVALAEPLELAVAEKLAASDVLIGLERRRLIVVDSMRQRAVVRLTHPLFGDVLRADLPAMQKRAHLRALFAAHADVARVPRRRHDVLRRVLWQLDGGAEVEADELAAAAAAASSLGGADIALRLARLAWERRADQDHACLLATALLGAGRIAEVDAFCAALALPDGEAQRTQIAVTWSIAVFAGLGDAGRAMDIIERFRPLAGNEGRHHLDAIEVMERFYAGHVSSALAVGERVLAAPGLAPSTRLLTLLPTVLALGTGGRTVEAAALGADALALAPAHAGQIAMAETQALCVWGYACAWNGRPAACVPMLEARRSEAHMALDHVSDEVLGVTLGISRMVEGRFELAASLFDELRPTASLFARSWQPYAEAWRAQCLARLGRGDEARPLVAASAGGGDGAQRAFLALAQAEIDAGVAARRAPAANALDEVAREADRHGQTLLALLAGFRALTLAPSHERAVSVLDVVARHDGRLAADMKAAVDGWCDQSVPALVHAAEVAERDGLGLLALDIWDLVVGTLSGVTLSPAKRKQLVRRQADLRRRLGMGDVATASAGTGVLTEREADIARLAANGLSDKLIAEKVKLSVRTVNAHLRTVYLKLGVGGRGELATHPLLTGGALPPDASG